MKAQLSMDKVTRQSTGKKQLPVLLFTVVVISALFYGWRIRGEYIITAQDGVGYALGIIGGSMMLLLLVYPIKKRFHHSRFFVFSTRNWFKVHMILGIVGPLLVLFHTNFRLGSTNSNVALASMLLMVSSGLVGRFIYGKIHHGLYGNKILLNDLLLNKLQAKKQIEQQQQSEHYLTPQQLQKVQQYEATLNRRKGLWGSLFSSFMLTISTRIEQRKLRQILKKNADSPPHLTFLIAYMQAVRKIAGLSFYERLFSLWHMLHMPIFFMLVITGFVHVYAVHAY